METFILTIYEKNIEPTSTYFKSTDFSWVNVINECIDIASGYDKGGQWLIYFWFLFLSCQSIMVWGYSFKGAVKISTLR